MLIQNKSAQEIAEENDWIQNSNEDEIKTIIQVVFQENKVEFERLKQGDQKLMGFFMGKIMQKSQGKADPKSASKLINELIKNS